MGIVRRLESRIRKAGDSGRDTVFVAVKPRYHGQMMAVFS